MSVLESGITKPSLIFDSPHDCMAFRAAMSSHTLVTLHDCMGDLLKTISGLLLSRFESIIFYERVDRRGGAKGMGAAAIKDSRPLEMYKVDIGGGEVQGYY